MEGAVVKCRVEFLTIGSGRGRLGGQIDVAEGELIGAASVEAAAGGGASAPVTVPDAAGQIFAEISVSGGAAYVAIGANPNPLAEPRCLVVPVRPRLLHVRSGQTIVVAAADDIADILQAGGSVAVASPTLSSGERGALSLNAHGAVRTIRQRADGTDVDETAPQETVSARSGTVTTAQIAVATTAAIGLAASTARKRANICNTHATATLYWGATPALTAGTGMAILPGQTRPVIEGYTGDVYLVGSAALTATIEQLQ